MHRTNRNEHARRRFLAYFSGAGLGTGRARYARRTWLSEAPNGWIKEVLGFRRFSFRGLEKVRAAWDLVCLAVNIKRIGALASAS